MIPGQIENSRNILIIDDEINNIEIIKNGIKQEGYAIYYALKPAIALGILKQVTIDLILLDLISSITFGSTSYWSL